MAVEGASGALIGRTAERAVLDRLVLSAARGSGAVVFVEGEAGIGKSRLVQSVVEAAGRRDFSCLVGAARPLETTRPFGAVAEALGVRRGSPDPRRAELAALMSGERKSDVRYEVLEAALELIEVESRSASTLIVLEDLHWADESTCLVLRALLQRVALLPVLVVVSLRPAPRTAELDLVLAEALESGAQVLQLGPLAPAEVLELVRAESGRDADLESVAGKAGGNPLWVVEIARSVSADGSLPDSFGSLVLRRLRYLPDTTLATLRVAAVLGDVFSLVDLSTVTGCRAVDLVEDLRPAVGSRLLREESSNLAFRHQLVYDAIYHDIPEAGRVALHREVARVLADAGAPVTQVAAHVLRGATPGDAQAAAWLRAAAREALPRAPEVGVELLQRARLLLPSDDLAVELAEALLRSGRVADCAALAEEILKRPHSSPSSAALRLLLVEALSLQNRGPELVAQADAALASPDLSEAERALVLAQAAYGRTFSNDVPGGEHSARAAVTLAERAGAAGMRVWSLTTLSFAVKTQARYAEAVDLTRRAVEIATDSVEGRLRHPYFFLGMALADADDLVSARQAYNSAVAECTALGSSWILPDIQQLTGELHFELGAWDDALVEFEAGLHAAAARGNRVAVTQSTGYQALILAGRGDLRAADALLGGLSEGRTYGVEVAALARAVVAENRGDLVGAFHYLLSAWLDDLDGQVLRFLRQLGPPLARLGVVVGRPDVAASVADSLEETVALASDVVSVQAAALRCRGLADRDRGALLQAVDLARSSPRVLDRAATFEDAAALTGPPAAQPLLVEALDIYEAVGASVWAGRVRASLRAMGVRVGVRRERQRPATGWASLTETELAVARLVAEGLTNREAAGRLFVSPHTVNTHLRHIFGKLGVSSRSALTAAVLQQDHAIK